DDVVVKEGLQNDQAQSAAKSQNKSGSKDQLLIWRHGAVAHHHRFVNHTLLYHVGRDRDSRLSPLFQKVVVYIIAEVVATLYLHQFTFIAGQSFQLRVEQGNPAVQIIQGNRRRVYDVVDVFCNGRLDIRDL